MDELATPLLYGTQRKRQRARTAVNIKEQRIAARVVEVANERAITQFHAELFFEPAVQFDSGPVKLPS